MRLSLSADLPDADTGGCTYICESVCVCLCMYLCLCVKSTVCLRAKEGARLAKVGRWVIDVPQTQHPPVGQIYEEFYWNLNTHTPSYMLNTQLGTYTYQRAVPQSRK